MLAYFWVAVGGALSRVARYWFSGWITSMAERQGNILPSRSLVVNISGSSYALGVLFGLSEPACCCCSRVGRS